jgi:colanic acid/amylovoran biosynthesis glycosyltransferase
MPTIAYIANEFPNDVEWYVAEEIRELRRQGAAVRPYSARKVRPECVPRADRDLAFETICLCPLRLRDAVAAAVFCVRNAGRLTDFFRRIFLEGGESIGRRIRALVHTLLGAACALRLQGKGVDHIHAHHGYYASWIAMIAARLLRIPFSLTLHGSDLLVNGSYLDLKLKHCVFCRTISEYNRNYILAHFPQIPRQKTQVERLGVEVPAATVAEVRDSEKSRPLKLVAVGRLHAVKNHQFLVRACYLLRESGVDVDCWIVGQGPEHGALQFLIHELHLEASVRLVGGTSREDVGSYYEMADLVVLTSVSEGIPLVLMEAMARARVVLAPAITGIPELVIDGKTGFLYPPDDLEGFVWRVDQIGRSLDALGAVRRAAREQVRTYFERQRNLQRTASGFLARFNRNDGVEHEDSVLQQI